MDSSAHTTVEPDGPGPAGPGPRPTAVRVFLVAGIVLIAFGLVTILGGGGTKAFRTTPFDLTINMVAAERLVDREPLYDADASRAQAVERSGEAMSGVYTVPTNGFPGPPSTALVHVPFLLGSDDAGYAAFRWVSLLGMLGGIALAALALPGGARLAGGVFGTGVLLACGATVGTIDLGQGHGFVMLGFGAAIWGVASGRWKVVGVGLGVATALKLSPALIVLYLAVRAGRSERRQLLITAAATVGVLTLTAAVVGRPADLWVWATEVVPTLSGGAYKVLNQSLPALADRTFSSSAEFNGNQEIGAWRHLALPMLALAAFALYRLRRRSPIDPMEIGVLLVAGLVAGPLTWAHYATWAALPIVLLADPRRWTGRSRAEVGLLAAAIAIAVLMLTVVVEPPTPAAILADPALRTTSSPYAFAFVLLLAVSYRLLARPAPASTEDQPPIEDTDAPEPVLAVSG